MLMVEALEVMAEPRLRGAVERHRFSPALTRDRAEDAERSAALGEKSLLHGLDEENGLCEVEIEESLELHPVPLEFFLCTERGRRDDDVIDPDERLERFIERAIKARGISEITARGDDFPGAADLEIGDRA